MEKRIHFPEGSKLSERSIHSKILTDWSGYYVPGTVLGNVQSSDQNTRKFRIIVASKYYVEKAVREREQGLHMESWRGIFFFPPFSKPHVESFQKQALLPAGRQPQAQAPSVLRWAGGKDKRAPQTCCSRGRVTSRPTSQTGDSSPFQEETLPGQPEKCLSDSVPPRRGVEILTETGEQRNPNHPTVLTPTTPRLFQGPWEIGRITSLWPRTRDLMKITRGR